MFAKQAHCDAVRMYKYKYIIYINLYLLFFYYTARSTRRRRRHTPAIVRCDMVWLRCACCCCARCSPMGARVRALGCVEHGLHLSVRLVLDVQNNRILSTQRRTYTLASVAHTCTHAHTHTHTRTLARTHAAACVPVHTRRDRRIWRRRRLIIHAIGVCACAGVPVACVLVVAAVCLLAAWPNSER